jgi:hypothetical protein
LTSNNFKRNIFCPTVDRLLLNAEYNEDMKKELSAQLVSGAKHIEPSFIQPCLSNLLVQANSEQTKLCLKMVVIGRVTKRSLFPPVSKQKSVKDVCMEEEVEKGLHQDTKYLDTSEPSKLIAVDILIESSTVNTQVGD